MQMMLFAHLVMLSGVQAVHAVSAEAGGSQHPWESQGQLQLRESAGTLWPVSLNPREGSKKTSDIDLWSPHMHTHTQNAFNEQNYFTIVQFIAFILTVNKGTLPNAGTIFDSFLPVRSFVGVLVSCFVA